MEKNMLKKIIAIASIAALTTTSAIADNMINGSGSSFVYPLMAQWTTQYANKYGTKINYQPIGSSGGINQLQQKTVDFAASDQPLTIAELNQYGWSQFPIAMGGIVPIVHINGIANNQLILDGNTLANIYMGQDKYWDAADIKKLNPKINLPHQMIIPVHRADGSGTTYNFTNYLSEVSAAFKKVVGVNTLVDWPGMGIGAKGNAGVANQVQTIPGAIGYVEYAYANQANLPMTEMKNAAGATVAANLQSFTAAAANAQWSATNGYNTILTNQQGQDSWPIVATTFILLDPKNANTPELKKFFNWAFHWGAAQATKLDYVAVPANVYQQIPALKS
jgi:phosphate transport system substrate-binding protein